MNGLKLAGARGLSFDLQIIPEIMPQMGKIAAQASDTKIALCHAGSPHYRSRAGLRAYARALKHLSELENVTCKLSSLGMFDHESRVDAIRPVIEICLNQLGADRCMFGSNFPVDMLYSDYTKLAQSYFEIVPSDMQTTVFSEVAEAFYFRLGPPSSKVLAHFTALGCHFTKASTLGSKGSYLNQAVDTCMCLNNLEYQPAKVAAMEGK